MIIYKLLCLWNSLAMHTSCIVYIHPYRGKRKRIIVAPRKKLYPTRLGSKNVQEMPDTTFQLGCECFCQPIGCVVLYCNQSVYNCIHRCQVSIFSNTVKIGTGVYLGSGETLCTRICVNFRTLGVYIVLSVEWKLRINPLRRFFMWHIHTLCNVLVSLVLLDSYYNYVFPR